jgi:hypothetical protein
MPHRKREIKKARRKRRISNQRNKMVKKKKQRTKKSNQIKTEIRMIKCHLTIKSNLRRRKRRT